MVAGHEGRQQPVIGIVPWRGVQGAPELERKAVNKGNGLVFEYQAKTGAPPPPPPPPPPPSHPAAAPHAVADVTKGPYPIDPHHSHFIFVDDGRDGDGTTVRRPPHRPARAAVAASCTRPRGV